MKTRQLIVLILLAGAGGGMLYAFPLELAISGGINVAHDKFTANRTVSASGMQTEEFASSESRGGYCLETGLAYTGMGNFSPFCRANYAFDRSKLRSGAAPQYLRSRGLAIITGMSYTLNVVFASVTLLTGAGFDWGTMEQQNEYFGGVRFSNNGPLVTAGLSIDSPLYLGIWTSLGYKYVYKLSATTVWSDRDIEYSFAPGRDRHYLTFGLVFKP